MKILLTLPTPGGLTGAPRRVLTLARALRVRNIESCIAIESVSEMSIAAARQGTKTLELNTIGVLALRGRALFGGGLLFRLRVMWALLRQNISYARAVRSFGADVVWARGAKGIAFSGIGAFLARRPMILDIDYDQPSRGMVRWLHRFGLWASVTVVFQYRGAPDSIFGKELTSRYRHKFKAITPGIDLPSIDAYRERRSERWRNNYDSFKILQVGTLCDRKNQMFMLDVLQRVVSQRCPPDVRLILAGGMFDESYVQRLRQAISERGLEDVVELLGWRDDVHELVTDSDLLVMPSRDEGIPNTVQEAMYIGLPVLVSDRGGMPEVVHNEKTGWVVSLDNPHRWAERITECVMNPSSCERVTKSALEYAIDHFGTDEWGRQYADIILKARGDRKRSSARSPVR